MAAKSYSLDYDGYWRAPNISGLPANSGIYCVCACVHNVSVKTVTLRRLLYIGEAENVRNRIANHERWDDWVRELKAGEELCFNAALISPTADRERAEAAMIPSPQAAVQCGVRQRLPVRHHHGKHPWQERQSQRILHGLHHAGNRWPAPCEPAWWLDPLVRSAVMWARRDTGG